MYRCVINKNECDENNILLAKQYFIKQECKKKSTALDIIYILSITELNYITVHKFNILIYILL